MAARRSACGFSLTEIVLATGICAFVLVSLMGLFSVGLRASRESEEQIQAANLASLLIQTRRAAPLADLPGFAIPAAAMTNAYADAYAGEARYADHEGRFTDAATAAYSIACRAGTNTATGADLAQVYLRLGWPAQADPNAAAASCYETVTLVPLR